MNNTKQHYYWIDLLRFISAFLVMLAHYRGSFFVEYGLLPENQQNIFTQLFYLLTRFGEEPVLVFFVLSGYLVGGSAIQKILNNQVDIQAYTIDRLVRIYLPLIASSILVIIIALILNTSIPYVNILGSLLSLQGVFTTSDHNVVLWSLSYEVWFYVLMGCIMVISRRRDAYAFISFIVIAVCVYFFIKLKPLYLFIWFMGAFAFLLPQDKNHIKRWKILLLLTLMGVTFILSQIASESRSISIGMLSFLNRDVTSIALTLVTCLLIHHLIASPPKNKIATHIELVGGKLAVFSYSLYLTHYPLMALLTYYGFPKSKELSFNAIALFIITVCIALIVAYLSYMASEKHTYRVKQWIKKSMQKN